MNRRIVAATAVLALALAGCSTSTNLSSGVSTTSPAEQQSSSPATAVPTVSVAPTGAQRTITFTTDLTSIKKNLHIVGPTDQITYGWNNLAGVTAFDGEPAATDLQGSVWYVNGNGPFTGFLTITTQDGSTIGFAMNGQAVVDTEGVTTFTADLKVIGGTKKYANATGSGSWTGKREGAIGTAVTFRGTVDLTS